MKQVDPLIYSGVDRAERRRVAKELLKAKELRAHALEDAAKLRMVEKALGDPLAAFLQNQERAVSVTANAALAAVISRATAVPPLRLLACAECHRPTTQCTCLDGDGNRLQW